MKSPTNFAELADALLLIDGRITLDFSRGEDEPGAWCAHLSTSIRGAKVTVEFGATIPEAIDAAFKRHGEKVAKYREQHPEQVS